MQFSAKPTAKQPASTPSASCVFDEFNELPVSSPVSGKGGSACSGCGRRRPPRLRGQPVDLKPPPAQAPEIERGTGLWSLHQRQVGLLGASDKAPLSIRGLTVTPLATKCFSGDQKRPASKRRALQASLARLDIINYVSLPLAPLPSAIKSASASAFPSAPKGSLIRGRLAAAIRDRSAVAHAAVREPKTSRARSARSRRGEVEPAGFAHLQTDLVIVGGVVGLQSTPHGPAGQQARAKPTSGPGGVLPACAPKRHHVLEDTILCGKAPEHQQQRAPEHRSGTDRGASSRRCKGAPRTPALTPASRHTGMNQGAMLGKSPF